MSRVFCCALVGWSLLILLASQSLGQETLPRPNEAEARIGAALKQPTKLEFVDQPMSNVFDFLQEHHKIAIQIDNRALSDEGIGSDTPITVHLDGISLRSALGLVLGQLDLTYVVRNEVLMITTRTEAENMLILKIYPVGDLVSTGSEFRSPTAQGEGLDGRFPVADYAGHVDHRADHLGRGRRTRLSQAVSAFTRGGFLANGRSPRRNRGASSRFAPHAGPATCGGKSPAASRTRKAGGRR